MVFVGAMNKPFYSYTRSIFPVSSVLNIFSGLLVMLFNGLPVWSNRAPCVEQ